MLCLETIKCDLLLPDHSVVVCYTRNESKGKNTFIWFVALAAIKQQRSWRKVRRPCRICHSELPISQVFCLFRALFLSLTFETCRRSLHGLTRTCGSKPSCPYRTSSRLPVDYCLSLTICPLILILQLPCI